MQGISVIMPSYLGEYPGSRKDPDKKFIRAVESFKDQTLAQKELIIVSDGCARSPTNYIKRDGKRIQRLDLLFQKRWQ